ncbi:MAG: GNAT family N-acetyltransferase [Rhodobacteraceae bacterium]|nr:GNAT family N-acetyltransferase [Paracoccaceae bacterium]
MMREAVPADAKAIDAFLAEYAESSMYLRGNLARHGIGFGDDDHSTRFFLVGEGRVEGVLGITKSGYLMAQVPGLTEDVAGSFLHLIADRPVMGMTGVSQQVETVLTVAGLQDATFQLRHDEPLYRLDLNDLPEEPEPCRPMTAVDLDLLVPWFASYLVDTGQADAAKAAEMAPDRARADLAGRRVQLLIEDGRPVAMANLNAVVGSHVQVGGVYVPTETRSAGLGRRVTIGLLQNARQYRANTAVLFANNAPAASAYEAIGFEQIGWYGIALLAQPERLSV